MRSPLGDLRPRERRGIGARRAVRGGVPFCCSCGSRGHQARGLIKPTALHLKQMKVTLRLGLFIGLTVLCRSFIMLETTKERTTKGVDHEPGSRTDLQPPTLAGAPVLRTRTRRRRRTRKMIRIRRRRQGNANERSDTPKLDIAETKFKHSSTRAPSSKDYDKRAAVARL